MKKLKETVTRLEKTRGLTKASESDQLLTLRQERDKLQKEKDTLTTDLKKVYHKEVKYFCVKTKSENKRSDETLNRSAKRKTK